jgi:hypothetical protein
VIALAPVMPAAPGDLSRAQKVRLAAEIVVAYARVRRLLRRDDAAGAMLPAAERGFERLVEL